METCDGCGAPGCGGMERVGNELFCDNCLDAMESEANAEMGLPDGFDWGCK